MKGYEASVGSKYKFEVEFVWKKASTFATIRNLKFRTKNYATGDTVKAAKDLIIKFVWPDDTLPGSNFIKTYQFP